VSDRWIARRWCNSIDERLERKLPFDHRCPLMWPFSD
jgi:hypothetical protein